MSLINDALRKAQRDRGRFDGTSDPSPPSPMTPPPLPVEPTTHASASKPSRKSLSTGLVLGAFFTAVLAGVVLLAVGIFGGEAKDETDAATDTTVVSPPPVAAAEASLAEAASAAQDANATAPATSSVPAQVSTPSQVAASGTVVTEGRDPVAAPVPPPAQIDTAPLSPVATSAPATAAESAATDEPAEEELVDRPRIALLTEEQLRSKAFIDTLRITSVRGTGANTRAMIGGRLYRAGDFVDPTRGIRMERIEDGRVIFSDPSGYEFGVNF